MSAIDFERVLELIARFEESELSVLDLQLGGDRIRLESGSGPIAAKSSPPPAASVERDPIGLPSLEPPAGATVQRSTIIGTFYRAPDPKAPPFVEIGDRVERGQIVCIVEAMKLMNEIEAETDGVVLEIPATNGEPVGYDQPLLVIGPAEHGLDAAGVRGSRPDEAPAS